MKRIGLTVLVCVVIFTGCNNSKSKNINTETNSNLSVESKDHQEGLKMPRIDLNTEKDIKDYLIGEWVFDKEYMSNCICNMTIDYDLNIKLIFHDKYLDEFKGEYVGKITLERQYSNLDQAPDLISIKLADKELTGGDFFFLHRTTFDKKNVMSLFFAGNGNSIFDSYLYAEESDYAPNEIIFEKESEVLSKPNFRKDDKFYAVFWGKGEDEKNLWLDDVLLMPKDEYDPDTLYPSRMNFYENNVKESTLYEINSDNIKNILGDDLFPGQVYFVQTDLNGNIIDFINAEDKENIDLIDAPYGYELFLNSDIGTSKVVKSLKEINLIKNSGPFNIKITDVQVLDFILSDEYKEEFENKDKLTVVTMTMEVENKSTDKNWIDPLGIIVTNTKEQTEAYYELSDNIGGDYISNNIKKGTILFMLNSESKDIKKIIYSIEGAKDENFNSIGEDIEFEIKF